MHGFEPRTQSQRRKKSVEGFDVKLLTQLFAALSILVITLAAIGQIELMIGFIVAACVGIAWWALRLNELSTTRAERFIQLRRIARLRNEDSANPSPVVVFGIAVVFAAFFCWNLSSSWRQYCAANLPMVQGQVTRHELVDIDLGSQLKVEYDYQVAGKRYHGNRLRFVYRAFRVGTDDAKKLAATWKLGNKVSVFYNPKSPTRAVLDNTFCKGDELQVGLNACGLMLSVIVMIGAAYVQLRTRETEIVADAAHGRVVIPLSNVPLVGAFAAFIAFGSLIITFVASLGGLISMGDAEIPWLVATIDRLYVVTVGLFAIALTIYIGERASFGLGGRKLVIDQSERTISWPSETIGEYVSRNLAQVKMVQVVSNREDWYRMGRTFSVVVSCQIDGGRRESRTLQRTYHRRDAVSLASIANRLIPPRRDNISDFQTELFLSPA